MATQKQKEKALERAASAQTRYWDALHALEAALGFDIEDGGPALEDCTVEYLEQEQDELERLRASVQLEVEQFEAKREAAE